MVKREIQASEIWNEKKVDKIKDFILSHSNKQSQEQLIKNELLAIKYQLEDYVESDDFDKKLKILDFVKGYLSVLHVTQRSLAELFEMHDSNLFEYLTGERKLNNEFVLKLSAFSHIEPEYWFRVETKNELFELNKERGKQRDYKKYDYRNLLKKV